MCAVAAKNASVHANMRTISVKVRLSFKNQTKQQNENLMRNCQSSHFSCYAEFLGEIGGGDLIRRENLVVVEQGSAGRGLDEHTQGRYQCDSRSVFLMVGNAFGRR